MAGLTVGGWFASAAISKMADKVKSYLEDEWEYQAGDRAKIQKLERHLTVIKAVIHAAHKGQIENRGLSTWLWDIKDAVYAAEDVLDNIEYQILEEKVKGLNQVHGNILSSSHAVAKSANTHLKRIFFCDEDLNKLNAVVETFDSIASGLGNFLKLLESGVGTRQHDLEWRVTASTPIENKIFGREKEIENLVKLLTEREDKPIPSDNKFDVISIYGIGGVGKTTLAQAVYNNHKVMEFFSLRVWICVSNDFDTLRLTKKIIESARIETDENVYNFQNLDTIQEFLKRGLTGKRFLIVLDDTWNEVHTKWETLRTPFMCGTEGSKVIVTTRSPGIANMMSTKKPIALERLEKNDFWLFFTQCAFGNKDPTNHPRLKSIASEIAEKLGGLPLAAKTVGGILEHNLTKEHWRSISQSNLWQLEQREDDILPALRLSYEHLPVHLKQCFVYCSLFPKDYHFDKNELISMWMAQDFILPNSMGKRMEDIGREYFELLLNWSFFQHAAGQNNRYVTHDLMHDLAQFISSDEYCIITNDKPLDIPKRVRHLFFEAEGPHAYELCVNASKLKNLRSLIIARPIYGYEIPMDVIMMLRSLRVLVAGFPLSESSSQFLGSLMHLRYLSLRDYCTMDYEHPLTRLYHLQGLHLLDSDSLPKEINQLINLRSLIAPPNAVCNIPDIGRLTSLQELEKFHVKKERGYELRQLKDLRQLRGGLSISNLHNVEVEDDTCNSVLINMEHLTALELEWSSGASSIQAERTLERLRPHCNLKELKIRGYSGERFPSWLDPNCLVYIELICFDCFKNWGILPPFGQFPFLKVLKLIDMRAVKQIDQEFYGSDDAFPRLEELAFEDMWNLVKWSKPEEGCSFFPRLRVLHIRNCPMLKGPLPVTSLLKKLVIDFSTKLGAAYPGSSPRIDSTIAEDSFVLHAGNIALLPRWLPAETLSALRELEIRGSTLVTSTEDWFLQLSTQLISFHISA